MPGEIEMQEYTYKSISHEGRYNFHGSNNSRERLFLVTFLHVIKLFQLDKITFKTNP